MRNMYSFKLITLVLFFWGVTSHAGYEVLTSSVQVGSVQKKLIVTRPTSPGPHPALLLIGGLGCYSLDFSGPGPHVESYKKIIELAADRGFVTMRVEKGDSCLQQNFEQEVQSFEKGLEVLKSYPFVKNDRIMLFGHSIGGVIAPLLAEKIPVHSVVAMGTLAEKWIDYDKTNTIRQMYLANMPTDQILKEMTIHDKAMHEFFVNKKSPQDILKTMPEAASYMQFPVHYTYMQQLADLDMAKTLKKSNADVVLLYGEADFIGSQWPELERFAADINKERATPIQIQKIPALDHFFRNAETVYESFYNVSFSGQPLVFQEKFLTVLEVQLEKLK